MKIFFDDEKGRLIEEESAILKDGNGFFCCEKYGVSIKSCKLKDDDGTIDRYISLDCKGANEKDSIKVLSDELFGFLADFGKIKSVLCCGIGNPYVICDSLGAKTIRNLAYDRRDGLKLAVAMPHGLTGIESSSVVRALCSYENVDLCIIVDSLSARGYEKIGTTFQFTDSGIVPGSAVGGVKPIDDTAIGVPVIAMGVPTVIRGGYLGADVEAKGELFTPPNVDNIIDTASSILSKVIIRTLKRITKRKLS